MSNDAAKLYLESLEEPTTEDDTNDGHNKPGPNDTAVEDSTKNKLI
ncbi:hypothetical protein K3495_g3985 [Podosphaera aphanis]|nr:hypothetical protein K3495_g3985 [Podosphaera aphanis]